MTKYGIDEFSENRLSKPLRIVSLVLLVMFAFVEGYRTFGMFENWSKGGLIGPLVVSVLATVFSIVIAIVTMLGNRKALVLWFGIGALNLVVAMTSIYKITSDMVEGIIGMPQWLALVYLVLHVLLAVSIGIYGWSLSRPSVSHESLAKRKAKDFGEFIDSKTVS